MSRWVGGWKNKFYFMRRTIEVRPLLWKGEKRGMGMSRQVKGKWILLLPHPLGRENFLCFKKHAIIDTETHFFLFITEFQ